MKLVRTLGLASVLAWAVGCSSDTTSNVAIQPGSYNVPGTITLRFDGDTLPADVDSVQAVFLDGSGARIGEPIEVPLDGQNFTINQVPSNFETLEVDYLRNGGFALYESFHQRGGTSYQARGAFSSTDRPLLQAATPGSSRWSVAMDPGRFQVEAVGNPGNDANAENKVFKVKGVGYSPAPIGFSNTDGPGFGDLFWDGFNIPGAGNLNDWSKTWKRDIENIRGRFNSIRTYSMVAEHINNNGQFENPPIVRTHTKFLDACWNNGHNPVYVVVGIPMPSDCFILPEGASAPTNTANIANWERVMASTVAQTKDHPAVMGYTFFNEWGGTNEWGADTTRSDFYWGAVQRYSQQIKAGAPDKLCGFAWFDGPSTVAQANSAGYLATYGGSLDYWGVNAFQATTVDASLAPYRALTGAARKPVLFTEFSVPATGHRDNSRQAGNRPTQASVDSIYADNNTVGLAAAAMRTMLPKVLGDDVVAGLLYFEWCDEWWKQESAPGLYNTSKFTQQGGEPADTSQMPNGYTDEEGFGLHSIGLNGRAADALYDPFSTSAAVAVNRPDILTPRTELLEAVTQALAPVR